MKNQNSVVFELKRYLLYLYRERNHYRNEHDFYKNHQIRFYNWFQIDPNYWLIRFIKDRELLSYFEGSTINIYSVFGHRFNIYRNKSDIKIFFTGENVYVDKFAHSGKYNDLFLKNKEIDLTIGFDYINDEKFIRFPLWLTYLFKPDASLEDITSICSEINSINNYGSRNKFCAFLARMDRFGNREDFYSQISKYGHIDCDGLFRHNNDDLKNLYYDNKNEYLKKYRFNLCPENSNHPGYCTEKIFESIKSGAIPLYWGTDNNPEPEILNHNRIIFIEPFKDNSDSLDIVEKIEIDRSFYSEFASQKSFKDDAPLHIYSYFKNLELKIISLAKK